jgi:hypothetical protein
MKINPLNYTYSSKNNVQKLATNPLVASNLLRGEGLRDTVTFSGENTKGNKGTKGKHAKRAGVALAVAALTTMQASAPALSEGNLRNVPEYTGTIIVAPCETTTITPSKSLVKMVFPLDRECPY